MYHSLLKCEVQTPPDIARLIGVSKVTVHQWIKLGRVLAYKVGGRIYVPSNEVDRLVQESLTPILART